MRINFVTFSCNLTGGNRVVMELINALADRGHEVALVTFGKPEELNWIRLKGRAIHLKRTILEKIAGFFYRYVFGSHNFPEEETRKILAALPAADVNVATISYSGYAVHRSEVGVPFHYFMHYEPLVREEGYKQKIMEENYYLPTKKIANSTWLARTIQERTGQHVQGLVFPAIDHAVFYPRAEKQPIDKHRKIRIVSLAKYKWWKGFPEALLAIEQVRQAGYDIEFEAFGGAFDRNMLPEEVKHIPFTFAGMKKDHELAEFYASADLLVSASYFESFPLPPLEAMACGTPVVTTQFGTEDYAFHDQNAYVVEPRNPTQLAEGIIALIEDGERYLRFSREGIATAQRFTWERAAADMERIFTKALTEKARV